MKVIPRHGVDRVLSVGWSCLFVGILLVQRPDGIAADCTLEVPADMMRPLLKSAPADWKCSDLWRNVLLHFDYTLQNLTACEARVDAITTPEPSFTSCQLMLDKARQDLEDGRRMQARDMASMMQTAQLEIQKEQIEKTAMEKELRKIEEEWSPLYHELLLTNIGVGNVKQALKYYHLNLQGHPPDALYGTLVQWVYRDPKHENQRLDNLLTFVRHLTGKAPKLTMYRLLKPEILKRQQQREGYLAAVAGLDAGRIVFDDNNQREYHLYTDLYDPVELRWKNQVLAGEYGEVIAFANSHPMHFAEVETSFSTFKPDEWKRLNLDRFVTFPNLLPLPQQRLEALLMILLQLQERNKHNFKDYLVKLAKEVHICEALVKKSKNSDRVQDKLAEVKRKFSAIDGNNDYEYYLQESTKTSNQSR